MTAEVLALNRTFMPPPGNTAEEGTKRWAEPEDRMLGDVFWIWHARCSHEHSSSDLAQDQKRKETGKLEED